MTLTETLRRKIKPLIPPALRPQMWKALSNIQSLRAVQLPGTRPVHWARVVMNQATNQLVSQLDTESLKVLEISGRDWAGRFNYKSYQNATYPDFDICSDKLGETFDLIIAEQVFEHLLYPYKAAQNIYSMLNAGGHLLITTPFLLKVHQEPFDCTRWTETGLKHFLSECGFQLDSIITGSWGNRACVKSNLYRWTNFNRWIHSLKNEPEFPLVVWAMAKKQS